MREVRLDDDTGTATVIVSDYQLSLAIGKEGQNARLAARLTGWRIDIKSETQLAEEEAGYAGEEWAEGEWVENEAGEMVWQPAEGGDAVSAAEWSQGAEAAAGRSRGPADGDAAGRHRADAQAPTEADGGRCRSRRRGRRRRGARSRPDKTRYAEAPGEPGRPGIAPSARASAADGPPADRAGPGGRGTPTARWPSGRSHPGRGAWLCRGSPECVERAERRRAFEPGTAGRGRARAGGRLRWRCSGGER